MKTYCTKKRIVKRNIHGSFFLIDITDNYSDDNCKLYEINEMGNIIWEGLQKYNCKQIENIVNEILSFVNDDIEYETVLEDVKEYITILENNGFIEERSTNGGIR